MATDKQDLGPSGRVPVTLLTPRGGLVDREVDEVIAPGEEGELGVLPGHVAFLTALKPGVLTIRDGAQREIFAVGAGFLEVGAGGVTRILVDTAVPAASVDVGAMQTEKRAIEDELKVAADSDATSLLGARLSWVQARLDAHAAATKTA